MPSPPKTRFRACRSAWKKRSPRKATMTLKACCMRRQSCARRTPGSFGRLISERAKVGLPVRWRLTNFDRGGQSYGWEIAMKMGRPIDLDPEMAIARPADRDIETLIADDAIAGADERAYRRCV